jgi:phospholipid transport system transporter-binding protein
MNETCRFDAHADGSVSLAGPLTFRSVPRLFRDLEDNLSDAGKIRIIDLSAVTSADSAGLALLLEWQARQRRRGTNLVIRSAPENLLRLAELCEADELMQLSGRNHRP